MSLASGTRLGPYEIVAAVGAGGMGEVYRARDSRLDRSVAIKVLAPQFSASADVRERFEREARTISQLSHPHICVELDRASRPLTSRGHRRANSGRNLTVKGHT